jgi:branched-chain amino acid aminotransferase
MSDCIGKYYLLNGKARPSGEFDEALLNSEGMIYEVMRVEQGVPLFIEDHIARFEKMQVLSGLPFRIPESVFRELITELIRINNLTEGPVKLMFSERIKMAHLMKPYLPGPDEYRTGVKTILLRKERVNPNVKFWRNNFRDEVWRSLQENNAFEGILVNQDNEITEGSRSNIFFLKNKELFTAPDDRVLQGITRKKVIEICHIKDIKVNAEAIPVNEISLFEGAFLTGTSRKVLPVRVIDQTVFKTSHELVNVISNGFDTLVREYITSHSKADPN